MAKRIISIVRWWMRRPAYVGALGVIGGFWALAGVILGNDPYDIYPWGSRVVVPGNHSPFDMPRLIRAAARDPDAELILIGSSPTTLFNQSDLQQAYPGYANPWNVSYHGAAAADRGLVIDQFIKYSGARRFVISLDYFYARRDFEVRDTFPAFLYDEDIGNDLLMVGWQPLKSALREPRLPSHESQMARERAFQDEERTKFQSPGQMNDLRRAIDTYRANIGKSSGIRCSDMPALQQLLSQVEQLTAKGARVDIIVPPYSLAMYYDWASKPRMQRAGGATLLADQLAMRRCAAIGISQLPDARLYSIDLDFALVGDLANFRDSSHIEGTEGLSRFINMPNDSAAELTTQNIEHYAETLREAVMNYQFVNTKI